MKDNRPFHKKVEEFHSTFKQVINTRPTVLDKKTAKLRGNLIIEELCELMEAMGSDALNEFQIALYEKSQEIRKLIEAKRELLVANHKAALDALCDLQYVLSGTVVSMGFGDVIEEAFDEVHSSNMSKACKNQEEAQKTADSYGGDSRIEEQPDGTWLVFRTSDNKTLKNINYRPADLSPFIDRYQVNQTIGDDVQDNQ